MEALVLILVELLIAPAILLFGLLANVVAGLVLIVLELIAAILGLKWSLLQEWRRKRDEKKAAKPSDQQTAKRPIIRRKSRVWRGIEVAVAALFVIVLVAALLIETILFEPAARFVLRQVNERTPYTISAETISGSLFGASIEAGNVSVKTRPDNPLQLDFRVGQFSADAYTLSLVFPMADPAVDVAVSDVTGRVITPPRLDGEAGNVAQSERSKPRRDFVMETLNLNNIRLDIALGENAPILFEIDALSSEPLRSQSALFDLLFRSNMQARIDGSPFEITMVKTENGRNTTWNADALPLAILPKLTSEAPIAWLSEGTVALNVRDEWSRGARDDIDLDWQITLDNARFDVPDDVSLMQRTLALPLARYVNEREGPVELGFTLLLDPDGLQYATSLDGLGLWDALVKSISSTVAEELGGQADAVERRVDGLLDRTRNFLDRRSREQGNPE